MNDMVACLLFTPSNFAKSEQRKRERKGRTVAKQPVNTRKRRIISSSGDIRLLFFCCFSICFLCCVSTYYPV